MVAPHTTSRLRLADKTPCNLPHVLDAAGADDHGADSLVAEREADQDIRHTFAVRAELVEPGGGE